MSRSQTVDEKAKIQRKLCLISTVLELPRYAEAFSAKSFFAFSLPGDGVP